MDMTKKLTKDLIEMYWERKCLWQVNSKDYKRRDMKKKAYQEIVLFLRRNGVKDASPKLVREKIQNLRRAMRKEKKRIDSSGGAYSPTLWYYDLLMFVNDQYEDTGPISSTNISYEEKCDSEVMCEDTDEDLCNLDEDKIYENVECSMALPSNDMTKDTEGGKDKKQFSKKHTDKVGNTSEFEAIGINFTAKLKRMDAKQQIFAELLIQKVLARGLLGQLNNSTDLVDKL